VKKTIGAEGARVSCFAFKDYMEPENSVVKDDYRLPVFSRYYPLGFFYSY
jgi:hypothetical protein